MKVKCPRCGNSVDVEFYKQAEFFYCPNCSSCFLTRLILVDKELFFEISGWTPNGSFRKFLIPSGERLDSPS